MRLVKPDIMIDAELTRTLSSARFSFWGCRHGMAIQVQIREADGDKSSSRW
jgi:hypothetical protein